jgi:hypothetical protein
VRLQTAPTPAITPFTIDKRSPGVVTANEVFDFTIAVSFIGAASGVVVTDSMGAGLAFAPGQAAQWRQTAGGSRSGRECPGTWPQQYKRMLVQHAYAFKMLLQSAPLCMLEACAV